MNYFTMKFILIISVFLDFGMSAKQSTLSLDGQQSFVRRGIGFQYLSELGTGSSGNHKLIFFLSVEKLKNTALLLKVQVGDMLNILREKGLNFENVNLDKDVETLKGIIASRTNGHHNLLNNANLIIDQFQELLEIKKKILISELDLISNIIEEFEFNIINPSKKRAILPIVGQIGEVLFGLSSTSTVEKLSDKLEELSNDQEKVTKFISVSASVISELEISLNKLRNETLDQVSQSFKTFESELSDNALKITSSLVVNFAQIHNAVEKLTSNILNKLQSFRFHLEQLSKGLIQVLNGNFPVSVISPVKLISYLKFVQQSLPKGFELAIDDFRSGLIIETLKHVECSLEFDLINVLFVCDFPLSKILDSFQLYKTFEAPVAIRDSFTASGKQIYSVITNGEPYIGIGGDESSYIILDEGFMSSCFYVKSKIVCKRRFVIHKFPSSNSCAFSVFFNKTDLENLVCKRNLKTLDSLFIHSLSDSQFYFAGGGANNPISIRCLKGNQYNKTFSYRLNINNSLIVNIPDECSVTSEYFRINEEFFSYNLYNMSANLPNLTMDFHSVILEILGHSSDLVKTFIDFENSVVPNFKWKEGISSFSIPISELNELSRDISNKTREKKIVATGISIMTLVIIALFTFVGFLSWRLKQIWYKLLAVRASNLPLN